MPPPAEQLPPPLPLLLPPTEPQQQGESEEGDAAGQEADMHILPSTEPAETEESPLGEAAAAHGAQVLGQGMVSSISMKWRSKACR